MMKENMENKEMEQKEEKRVTNEQLHEEMQIIREALTMVLNNQALMLNIIADEKKEKGDEELYDIILSSVFITTHTRDEVDPEQRMKKEMSRQSEEGIKAVLKMLFSGIDK